MTSAPLAAAIAARRRAIFAACKAAGLDDKARHKAIHTATEGKRTSLTDCTLADLNAVLNHLNRGQKGYDGRKRVTPSPERAPLLSKVDALLAELHRVTGRVHPLAYADGVARRVCNRSSLDFCEVADLKKVVAALATTLRSQIAKAVP